MGAVYSILCPLLSLAEKICARYKHPLQFTGRSAIYWPAYLFGLSRFL